MTSWWRSWHGAPTDAKWLFIAWRANCAPGIVSAVFWALCDYASQQSERGSVEGFDTETYAAFSGFDLEQIDSVIVALKEKQIIDSGKLRAWEKRQPRREDDSSERVERYRNRRTDLGLPISSKYAGRYDELAARDGRACVYCGKTGKLVIDHMVPIILGGTDEIDNLALACKPCNGGKAGRNPEEAGLKPCPTASAALSKYRDRMRVTQRHAPERTEQIEQNREKEGARADIGKFRKEVIGLYAKHFADSHTAPDTGLCDVWEAQGLDPKLCVAKIDEYFARTKKFKPLNYFTGMLVEAHAVKETINVEKPTPEALERNYLYLLEEELRTGMWRSTRVAKSDIPPAIIEKWQSTRTQSPEPRQ